MLTTLIIGIIALVALCGVMGLNSSFIPGPIDEQTKAENAITKTADFDGTTLDMGAGYAPGGPGQALAAVIQSTALDKANADETYKFKVQESADGATWTDASPQVAMTAVGAISVPFFGSQRYLRVSLDVAGTTPSVTYSAWIVPIQ